jgi:hypothetical protein
MGTPLYMELKEACELVTNYAGIHTNGDFLAALNDMESCYDDLDREDRTAFNMVMRAGQAMFASGD